MKAAERRRRWRELVAEHREALAAFLATAETLSDATWNAPRATGKWSPGQIAEHLRLTCETIQAELERRGGFRVRTGWLRRSLLRALVMPRMLRTRRFPEGAPAVREIRPDPAARYERRETLDGLRRHADALVAALEAADPERVPSVTHPFFGRLDPLKGLDLSTLHVRHHHAQILEVAASQPARGATLAAAAPAP
jgi:hypothetical protein